MRNKYIFFLLISIIAVSNFGCKKLVEKVKEDAVMDLIVGNVWLMQSFSEDATDLTSSFSGYEFHFSRDYTVYGAKSGSPNAVGTWAPNAEQLTITSNFPTETGVFKKLNGTFIITNTTTTYVKAHRFEGAVEFKLWLVAK